MGILIVNTGDGKGKTTAALGAAVRALGHGRRVAFIQFIKSGTSYGEHIAANDFKGKLDFFTLGTGFLRPDLKPLGEEERSFAREALEKAREIMKSGKYDFIVFDEMTYLISLKLISEEDVIGLLKSRAENQDVIVTGRDASRGIIEEADTVSEFKEIKHPYKKGLRARKGIEY